MVPPVIAKPETKAETKPATNKAYKLNEVDSEPNYRGGNTAKSRFISSSMVYPAVEKSAGKSGKVVVSFVVGKDGRVRDELHSRRTRGHSTKKPCVLCALCLTGILVC